MVQSLFNPSNWSPCLFTNTSLTSPASKELGDKTSASLVILNSCTFETNCKHFFFCCSTLRVMKYNPFLGVLHLRTLLTYTWQKETHPFKSKNGWSTAEQAFSWYNNKFFFLKLQLLAAALSAITGCQTIRAHRDTNRVKAKKEQTHRQVEKGVLLLHPLKERQLANISCLAIIVKQ